MNKEKEELKDCPFCRHPAELKCFGNDQADRRAVIVSCSNKRCRARQKTGAIRLDMAWCEKTATDKWNKRVK